MLNHTRVLTSIVAALSASRGDYLTIKVGSIMHLVVRYFDSSVHMAMLFPASPLLPKPEPQRPGSAANTGQLDPNEPRDPGYWQSEEGKASAERARPKINLTGQ